MTYAYSDPNLVIADTVIRSIGILRYLSDHQEVPIAELARQFGVGIPTIEADIEELSCCSLPDKPGYEKLLELTREKSTVFYSPVPYGADQEVHVDLSLTPLEITVILLTLSSLDQQPELWDLDAVESLKKKLKAALPHDSSIADIGVDKPRDQSALLVKEAIEKGKQLEFDYLNPDSGTITHRLVDPVKFSNYQGHYYLESWDTTAADSRTFRTDRMRNVSITTAPDAAKHPTVDSDQSHPFGTEDCKEATIRVRENCTWVLDYVLLKDIKRKRRKDGSYTAVIYYFTDDWLIKWAIENSDRITVESPSSIAQAMKERVDSALVGYGVN